MATQLIPIDDLVSRDGMYTSMYFWPRNVAWLAYTAHHEQPKVQWSQRRKAAALRAWLQNSIEGHATWTMVSEQNSDEYHRYLAAAGAWHMEGYRKRYGKDPVL